MKKNMIFKLPALLLAIILAAGITACGSGNSNTSGPGGAATGGSSPDQLKTVNIGFPSAGGNVPQGIFGVAVANGYLDEYLQPLGYVANPTGFVGAAPAIHEALVAKELEYVIYAGMASDLSKANGIDHTLISVGGWSPFWILIAREGAGINTLADLKGKKISYTRGASPHMYLLNVLDEAGLTFDDIEPLNTTIPEGIAGITAGDIDAAVVSNGLELSLVQAGTVKVIHNSFAPENIQKYSEPAVFIARTDFHRENPDIAVAIQKALLKAKDWALEDPDRYLALIAEKSGQTIEVVKASTSTDIAATVPLNLDDRYIDSLKDILTFLKQNELTAGDIDFDSWVDKSVAKKAAEEYANGQ